MSTSLSDAERFAKWTDVDGPIHAVLGTPCHLWTGYVNADGYGKFSVNGKPVRAHRYAYGPAVGLDVDHVCHNLDPDCLGGKCHHRRCVNVEHLAAVEHIENRPKPGSRCWGGSRRRTA